MKNLAESLRFFVFVFACIAHPLLDSARLCAGVVSTKGHFSERHCENMKKERPWRIVVLIFGCIDERLVVNLMTPSNLV